MEKQAELRKGLLNGLAAYGLWGVMPLYFRALGAVPPFEILAHRIVWSFVVLMPLLVALRQLRPLQKCLRSPRLMLLLGGSTVFLGVNWLVFIYGISTDQVRYVSLGYFVNPLVSVLLGLLFFRERLRQGQWWALALAVGGLGYLVWDLGRLPWITLSLAFSFGFYGLLRKVAPVPSLVGLTVETTALVVPALGYLVIQVAAGSPVLGPGTATQQVLLVLSGFATSVPLLCFGAAARRLPLSVLGFLQYLAPSLQLVTAVLVFGEPLQPGLRVCFLATWVALAVLTVDALVAQRRRVLLRREAEGAEALAGLADAPARVTIRTTD